MRLWRSSVTSSLVWEKMAKEGTLKQLVDRYLESLASTMRPGTIRNHRLSLGQFLRHLEECEAPATCSELQREHVEHWRNHLAARQPPLANETRRKRLISLRIFLERVWTWGWIEEPREELVRREDLPPEDHVLPKPLSLEDDRALQAELEATGGLLPTALLFLRATGMRIGELLSLELDAVREQSEGQWSLHVPLGKLHTERVIPLEGRALRLIDEILHMRGLRQAGGKDAKNYLIRWPDNRRPVAKSLGEALRRAATRIGLKERVWPHRLRHTYATEMLRAGMSLPVLMSLLGHRTIKMTLRYAQVTQADVRNAYFSTIEKIKGKYEIPSTPGGSAAVSSPGLDEIRAQLLTVTAKLEGLRRSREDLESTQKIQRLVSRLRLVCKDLEGAR